MFRQSIICMSLYIFMLLLGLTSNANAVDKVSSLSNPAKVSDFKLSTGSGKTFTHEDLKGNWSLMTTGFTSCPDICPFVLSNLKLLSKELYAEHSLITTVILVALDPARDKAILTDYVKYFGDNVIGITGTDEQLEPLIDSIGASYSREPPDADGQYMVNHTAFAVLVSPEGKVVARINPPIKSKEAAAEIISIVNVSSQYVQKGSSWLNIF